MSLRHKNLADINIDDLHALKSNQVVESKFIEYKKDFSDGGKKSTVKEKFLSHVTAFANADGGDLVFGIDEEGGKAYPKEICGVQIENLDEKQLNLQNLIRDCIYPRLPAIDFRHIEISQDKYVLIIRVPRSWSAPHRVGQYGNFHMRNSNGTHSMDVDELRTAFSLNSHITERIHSFRKKRVKQAMIFNDGGMLVDTQGNQYAANAATVLHTVPLSAFSGATFHDIAENFNLIVQHVLPRSMGGNPILNIDGVQVLDSRKEHYAQFFRNGVIEDYDCRGKSLGAHVNLNHEEETISRVCKKHIELLKKLNVAAPVYIFYSMFGITSAHQDYYRDGPDNIDAKELYFPEIVINDFSLPIEDQLRPMFDMLWNTFGYLKSPTD